MPSEVITRGEQKVFVNGTEVRGVQTVGLQFQTNSALVRHVGMRRTNEIPEDAQVGRFSVSQLLVSDEVFLKYTGFSGVTGYIAESKDSITSNIGFNSGFLTSYSCRCGLGEVPQIDADFDVFGQIANMPSGQDPNGFITIGQSTTPPLKVAGPGSLSLTVDNINTNRIRSFDIQLSIPRYPVYILGDRNPISIETDGPVEVSCTLTLSAKDYLPFAMRDYPSSPRTSNVVIEFRDLRTDNTFLRYAFPEMKLKSQNYDAQDNSIVTLIYNGYLMPVPPNRISRSTYGQLGKARITKTVPAFTSGKAYINATTTFMRTTSGKANVTKSAKTNLLAYWSFASGGSLSMSGDSHTTNNHLTPYPNTTVGAVTGVKGTAVHMSNPAGVPKFMISGGTGFYFSGTNSPMTLSFWFHPFGIVSPSTFFAHVSGVAGQTTYSIYLAHGFLGTVGGSIHNGSQSVSFQTNNVLSFNRWNHYIFVYENTSGIIRQFLNGIESVRVPWTGGFKSFVTGTFYQLGSSYYGYMDEFAVWKRALNTEDCLALWSNGTGLAYSNLF